MNAAQKRTMPHVLRSLEAALLVLGGAHPLALAQTSAGPQPGLQPSATITPWFQGSADVDGGGGFHASGAIFRASVNGPISGGHRAGLSVAYDYTDYHFSSPAAFGPVAPWTDVQHVGLAAPFFFQGPSQWSLLVSPSVDYFKENDAGWSVALTYGAVLAASRSFGPDRRIGLGAGVFDRLEEVSVFPFILVDWRLTERLRLVNPAQAGPTGGRPRAQLPPRRRLDARCGWGLPEHSLSFARRRAISKWHWGGERHPGLLHAGGRFGQSFAMDLYAGALLGGALRVEDSSGGELAEQDFDPAPLLGATVSARF
jgi:hypothetical protein